MAETNRHSEAGPGTTTVAGTPDVADLRVSESASPYQQGASPFELRLQQNPRWALSEGSRYFEGTGAVQVTLQKITSRLDELQIPYSIVGGMALFLHGFRRFTEVVDILVTQDALRSVHQYLVGLGYRPLFEGSKHLRDAETGVRIEFLVTGGFPGDGKPKPVAFPDPQDVTEVKAGIRLVNLPSLIELKLASGMSGADRLKDLADVQELIKSLRLPETMAEKLNPYVREKYQELWRSSQRRFVKLLPSQAVEEIRAMQVYGAFVDEAAEVTEGYILLATTDPDLAAKYDMHDESEYWEGSA